MSTPAANARCTCGHRGDEHSGQAPHCCIECPCSSFAAFLTDPRTERQKEEDGQISLLADVPVMAAPVDPTRCPHCGAALRGLGRYCFACSRYVDQRGRAPDAQPEGRP